MTEHALTEVPFPPPPEAFPPPPAELNDFYGLAVGVPAGLVSGACIPLGLSLWRLAHRQAYPNSLVWYRSGTWWCGTLFYLAIGPACDLISTTCAGVQTAVMLRMSFLVWTPLCAMLMLQERFVWKADGASIAMVLIGLACFFPIADNMYSDYDYDEIISLITRLRGLLYLAVVTATGLAVFLWFLRSEVLGFQGKSGRVPIKLIPISTGMLNGISLCLSQAYTTMLFKSHAVDKWPSWLMCGLANGLMLLVNVSNVKSLRHNTVLEHVPVFIETELITVWVGGGIVYDAYRNFRLVDCILIPISMACIGLGAVLTTLKRAPPQLPLPPRNRGSSGSEFLPLLPDDPGHHELHEVAAPRAPLPDIVPTQVPKPPAKNAVFMQDFDFEESIGSLPRDPARRRGSSEEGRRRLHAAAPDADLEGGPSYQNQ